MVTVTNGLGTLTQATSPLGTFDNMPNTGGWQVYGWSALRDTSGNLAKFVVAKGQSQATLRFTSPGGMNADYFMVVPANPNYPAVPEIVNFTPDGSQLYQPSNKVTFTVVSAAGITSSGLSITVDGHPAMQVTTSGTANNLNVAFPIVTNATHTVTVVAQDAYGAATNTFWFAAFNQTGSIKIEGEDWDYNGGQFVPLAQYTVDGYSTLVAVTNIDYFRPNANGPLTYRVGLATEVASDSLESADHAGMPNYDLGYAENGDWANYTRDYPAGVYNIYERLANNGASSAGTIGLVTNGAGTTTQSVAPLGTFDSIPNTGGWQTYDWSALRDANGNLARFVTDGTPKTLRYTCSGGYNSDYFVLVPADSTIPMITNAYPNGVYAFEQTNTGTFTLESSVGINPNTIAFTLNGVAMTNYTLTGSPTGWTVTYTGLLPNSTYTVGITGVSSNNGVFSRTFSYDTYSSANYTWEAEDWDYTSAAGVSGQFFDNPQVCAYMNTFSTEGVDYNFVGTQNGTTVYRPLVPWAATNNWWFTCDAANDEARPQFPGTSTNNTDYNVGYWFDGSWAHYTRHYPAGTYNVLARMKEGSGPVPCTLSTVATPTGTGETMAVAGTFYPTNAGSWTPYQNVMMMDSTGTNLATITFNGSQVTLRFDATTNSPNPALNGDSININYFMLIPAATIVVPTQPTLTASVNADGQLVISFATQTGCSYQVEYQNDLTDTTWTPLGSAIAGTGATVTVTDALTASARFYQVVVTATP